MTKVVNKIKMRAGGDGFKESDDIIQHGLFSKADRYMSIGKKQSEMMATNKFFNE